MLMNVPHLHVTTPVPTLLVALNVPVMMDMCLIEVEDLVMVCL